MKQRTLIYRFVAILVAMSVAYNIYLYIENYDLKSSIEIYKNMINDYSEGNIDVIESAVIDSIETQKLKKNDK